MSYYTFGVGKIEGDDSVYASTHIGAGITTHRAKGKYINRERVDTNMCQEVVYVSPACE